MKLAQIICFHPFSSSTRNYFHDFSSNTPQGRQLVAGGSWQPVSRRYPYAAEMSQGKVLEENKNISGAQSGPTKKHRAYSNIILIFLRAFITGAVIQSSDVLQSSLGRWVGTNDPEIKRNIPPNVCLLCRLNLLHVTLELWKARQRLNSN